MSLQENGLWSQQHLEISQLERCCVSQKDGARLPQVLSPQVGSVLPEDPRTCPPWEPLTRGRPLSSPQLLLEALVSGSQVLSVFPECHLRKPSK